MAEEELTAEAKKQRRKREKAAEKNAALGVEKFTVEVAGVFKADLKRLMKQHGFNNQQEVFQNLLRNVIATDVETAAQMLKCVTTPFVVTEKVSRIIRAAGMKSLVDDPPDPDDEIELPCYSLPPIKLSGIVISAIC
jgi:virulence-associated protein VapD